MKKAKKKTIDEKWFKQMIIETEEKINEKNPEATEKEINETIKEQEGIINEEIGLKEVKIKIKDQEQSIYYGKDKGHPKLSKERIEELNNNEYEDEEALKAIERMAKKKINDINGDSGELILPNKEKWAKIIRIIANKTLID